jgi:hypothetical protein
MKKRTPKKTGPHAREEIVLIESWGVNFRRDGSIEQVRHKPEPKTRTKGRKSA